MVPTINPSRKVEVSSSPNLRDKILSPLRTRRSLSGVLEPVFVKGGYTESKESIFYL